MYSIREGKVGMDRDQWGSLNTSASLGHIAWGSFWISIVKGFANFLGIYTHLIVYISFQCNTDILCPFSREKVTLIHCNFAINSIIFTKLFDMMFYTAFMGPLVSSTLPIKFHASRHNSFREKCVWQTAGPRSMQSARSWTPAEISSKEYGGIKLQSSNLMWNTFNSISWDHIIETSH